MSAIRFPRLSAPTAARVAAAVARPAPTPSEDGFERSTRVAALHRGSTGPAVKALQVRLVKAGLLASADAATGPGVYGPRTEAGVRKFQAAIGLPATGIATAETQSALASGARFQRPLPPVASEPQRARMGDTFTDDDTTPMGGVD